MSRGAGRRRSPRPPRRAPSLARRDPPRRRSGLREHQATGAALRAKAPASVVQTPADSPDLGEISRPLPTGRIYAGGKIPCRVGPRPEPPAAGRRSTRPAAPRFWVSMIRGSRIMGGCDCAWVRDGTHGWFADASTREPPQSRAGDFKAPCQRGAREMAVHDRHSRLGPRRSQ
jgi:hypothetical protein